MKDHWVKILLLVICFPAISLAQNDGASCSAEILEITCGQPNPSQSYVVSFVVTNNTNSVVHKLLIPGQVGNLQVAPNIIDVLPPVVPGSSTSPIQITLINGLPGTGHCLPIGLMTKDDSGEEYQCCGTELCFELPICAVTFIRGDINQDGGCDISDAISLLGFLFGGAPCNCLDACDANDDGTVNIADAIYKLGYLFTGSGSPPAPFPDCGPDPTSDTIDCLTFTPCP